MKINYHGGGYVGLTGAMHYLEAGHEVVITDPDPAVVNAINDGKPKAGAFLSYLEVTDPDAVRSDGRLLAALTPDYKADAHIIAVPSEQNGEPFMAIVDDVFDKLAVTTEAYVPILVESTLMPGMARRFRAMLNQYIQAGHPKFADRPWAIAPRRDWFADRTKNLWTLTRVVGCDEKHRSAIAALVNPVCRDVRWTPPETAEITKALENALLHLPVVLLHELATLFPEYDMVEAAALASTHWRFQSMGTLYLGLGTGGRCVPLGSKYLYERGGALLGDAIEIDETFVRYVATGVIGPSAYNTIILGISYRPGFKDAGNSPGLRMALAIDQFNPTVFDPYFTTEEIAALRSKSGARFITVANSLDDIPIHDKVILTVAHPEFADAWKLVRDGATIIDATGMWEGHLDAFLARSIHYVRPGRPGWISEPDHR